MTGPAIPRIIHQTFKSGDLPPRMKEAADSWKRLNSGYDYQFHDDAAQEALIRDDFGEAAFRAYSRIEGGAFRADFWRYCVLWKTGGVYADIDTMARMPLDELIGAEDRFIAPNAGEVDWALFNAFICVEPGHPFLRQAIDRSIRVILEGGSFDGYMATGPGNLGAAVNLCLGRKENAAYSVGAQDLSGFRFRILEKRLAQGTEPRRVVDKGRTVFDAKYDGYLDDLKSAGVEHWQPGRSSFLRRAAQKLRRRFG